jgi:hypothetical protein
MLEHRGIYRIGRYGCWRLQGLADSIGDGFVAGSSFRTFSRREPSRTARQQVA